MISHDIVFSKDFESHIRYLEEVLKKATDEAQCIIMERNILASIKHPFIVNLYYDKYFTFN